MISLLIYVNPDVCEMCPSKHLGLLLLIILEDRWMDRSVNLSGYKKRFTFSRVKCDKPQLGLFGYCLKAYVM